MRHHNAQAPAIPPTFTAKKEAILASLAQPVEAYTDASPKGSVDEAIRDLIDRINALDGAVTTSSCAGRVSVFAEGRKENGSGTRKNLQESEGDLDVSGQATEGSLEDEKNSSQQKQKIVPGGKGNGGRWLYVSHEPLDANLNGRDLAQLFELHVHDENSDRTPIADVSDRSLRTIRFQFEPMILHVMTTSLHHAQPVLAAAINAGFRESGVQSLKNLADANAFPMVAVRTSGLAFESLIGYVEDLRDGEEKFHSLVTTDYLELLARIANERFRINTERTDRFEGDLFKRGGQG